MEHNSIAATNTTPSSFNPPDFYVGRGESGYAIGIEKTKDANGDFHIHTVDMDGHSTTTDAFEKGMTESKANGVIAEFLEKLRTKGFAIEEYQYSEGQKTENQTPITRTQKDIPEGEGKKVEIQKTIPERRSDTRVDSRQPQTEGEHEVDWGTVAESAGSTLLKGAGIAAAGAGLVALGAVSAPFLIGAGFGFSIGSGVNTFFTRANEAMDSGEDDYLGNAAAAGISDMIPLIDVVGIGEAATGFNYMTGEEMTQQERSEKLGGLIGGVAMDFIPIAGVVSSKAKGGITKFKERLAPLPPGKLVGVPQRSNKQSWQDSEKDTGFFLEAHVKSGEWSEQIMFKDGKEIKGTGRKPRDSTIPDWHNKQEKIAVESKRYDYLKKNDLRYFLEQAGGRIQSLPDGTKQWLVIDHRGQYLNFASTKSKHERYFQELGGTSVFEKIFIVTEKGIFEF